MSLAPAPHLRRALTLVLLVTLGASAAAHAQQGDPRVTAARRALEARDPAAALAHVEPVVVSDSAGYDALVLAAGAEVEVAEYDSVRDRRTQRLLTAVAWARRAVARDSTRAEGRFALARAAGLVARSDAVDASTRARLGRDAYEQATRCLAIAPRHPGCLHALGAWNATVAQLGGIERSMAAALTHSDAFGKASMADAESLLMAAVREEPRRIAHRLELGRIYAAEGKRDAAMEQLQAAVAGEVMDSNDPRRQSEARAALGAP